MSGLTLPSPLVGTSRASPGTDRKKKPSLFTPKMKNHAIKVCDLVDIDLLLKSELPGPSLPKFSPFNPLSPRSPPSGGNAVATTRKKEQKLMQLPSERKRILSSFPIFILSSSI
jgi:hypothetical protein